MAVASGEEGGLEGGGGGVQGTGGAGAQTGGGGAGGGTTRTGEALEAIGGVAAPPVGFRTGRTRPGSEI